MKREIKNSTDKDVDIIALNGGDSQSGEYLKRLQNSSLVGEIINTLVGQNKTNLDSLKGLNHSPFRFRRRSVEDIEKDKFSLKRVLSEKSTQYNSRVVKSVKGTKSKRFSSRLNEFIGKKNRTKEDN